MYDPGTGGTEDLLRRLAAGEFGPWAAQGFNPDGSLLVLRPNGQWENLVAGSADIVTVTRTLQQAGNLADMSQFEDQSPRSLDDVVAGIFTDLGITTGVGPTTTSLGGGAPRMLSIPAAQYTWSAFPSTELGDVRHNEGLSVGTGPLSPIRMGALTSVDSDGNRWLPVVRMVGIDVNRNEEGGF